MDLSKYTTAFSRLKSASKGLREQYGGSSLTIYWDFFWSRLIYGVTPNEYIGWAFYAKNRRARKSFYTARQFHRYEKHLNSPKYYDTFWDKPKFFKAFAPFVKRDWLYVAEATDEAINDFLIRYPDAIVKPTSQSSGKGIHHYQGETVEELRKLDTLLEKSIVQIKEMSEPNPSSVNSIRIYTMLDRNKASHILSACVRVGGYGSTTDNFHSGGVAYPIDLQYGAIAMGGVI